MKTTGLHHKGGGRITDIFGVGHETYKRVATWHYIGRVEWGDGSVSERSNIAPYSVVYDNLPESTGRVEYGLISEWLSKYLERVGVWLDKPKHMKDGRIVNWTANVPNGSEALS